MNNIFVNKTTCATIIDTPRNYYEQSVTETFFPINIWLFKVDHEVFTNFKAIIHSFLFHWGINMRWHRGHIPLFIHQHGKDKRTQIKWGKCVLSFINRGMPIKKIAARLKIPISTVRAILKKFKATVTVQTCLEEFILPPVHRGRMVREAKKSPKDHCWRITEESSILGSARLQNYP